MKYTIFLIITLYSLYFTGSYSAQASPQNEWSTSGGIYGNYTSENREAYIYYKPFIDITYTKPDYEIIAAYYRYLHYKIIDQDGNYEYINSNQAELEITAPFQDAFEYSIGYSFSKGEKDYLSHEYSLALDYQQDLFSLFLSGAARKTKYTLVEQTNKKDIYTWQAGGAYDATDSLSFSLDFEQTRTKYTTTDTLYTENFLRAGSSYFFLSQRGLWKKIIFDGGLLLGHDSDHYTITGGDCSLLLYVSSYIKISAAYTIKHYSRESSDESTKSNGKNKSSNPSLTSVVDADNYTIHTLLLGASYYF